MIKRSKCKGKKQEKQSRECDYGPCEVAWTSIPEPNTAPPYTIPEPNTAPPYIIPGMFIKYPYEVAWNSK